jgi:hypothetical protein
MRRSLSSNVFINDGFLSNISLSSFEYSIIDCNFKYLFIHLGRINLQPVVKLIGIFDVISSHFFCPFALIKSFGI